MVWMWFIQEQSMYMILPHRKLILPNEAGADYLVSIHRNAMPNPGTATGIETLVYADSGVRGKMARDINASWRHWDLRIEV